MRKAYGIVHASYNAPDLSRLSRGPNVAAFSAFFIAIADMAVEATTLKLSRGPVRKSKTVAENENDNLGGVSTFRNLFFVL
jgi:hypothetical protein